MDWTNGEYVLTDDRTRLDLDRVCALLHSTYWANRWPRSLIEKAVQNSVCFGLFCQEEQVGFARAVTDHATFTWVCDVVIHPDHQAKGLGTWMTQCLLTHPDLQTLTHALRTRDAQGLYRKFGFEPVEYLRRSSQPV